MIELQGIGIGQGVAIGRVLRMPEPLPEPVDLRSVLEPAAELARATASMQHVPSVSEDGVLDTQGGSTGAIARHGHVRKGSTMSRSGTAREHRRTDSNATARKQSLVSPTSAGAARSPTSAGSGRSPTTGGGEEEDAYGGIMLAYERGDE